MDEVVADSLAQRRFAVQVVGLFGVLALLLAGIGIYGVMAYSVSQRTREIGIRVALGASKGNIMKWVLRQGMILICIGLAAGLIAAFAVTRLLRTLLFGVTTTDLITYVSLAAVLGRCSAHCLLHPGAPSDAGRSTYCASLRVRGLGDEHGQHDQGYSICNKRSVESDQGFTAIACFDSGTRHWSEYGDFQRHQLSLLRPLPYEDPSRLVTFRSNQSAPDLIDVEAQTKTFSRLGGMVSQPLAYTAGAEPVQIEVGQVTGGYFDTLGVKPSLGRYIGSDDDKNGAPYVVVLSQAVWAREFNSNPRIVGKRCHLAETFTRSSE
jgi:hypothetical protein